MWEGEGSSRSQAGDGTWPPDHLTQAHKNMRGKTRASVWIQNPKQAGLAATGPTLECFLKGSRDRKATHGKKALREVLAPCEVLTSAAYRTGQADGQCPKSPVCRGGNQGLLRSTQTERGKAGPEQFFSGPHSPLRLSQLSQEEKTWDRQ